MEKCKAHVVVDEPDLHEYRDLFTRYAPDLLVTLCEDPVSPPSEVADAEILLTWEPHPNVIKAMPNLKWVQSTGAGVDGILRNANLSPDVILTRTGKMTAAAMAQYVTTFILVTHYCVPFILNNQKAHKWQYFKIPLIKGLRCTILGTGDIGQTIAQSCQDLGLNVVAVNRSGNQVHGIEKVLPVSDLDEVLPHTDLLVVVVPLTSETRGLIDYRKLSLLPQEAVLINVSRGPVIVEKDLVEAMKEGKLRSAVLDVFDQEPLPPDSPLWDMENVVVTPHIAGNFTVDFSTKAFLENLNLYLTGKAMNYIVDYARGY